MNLRDIRIRIASVAMGLAIAMGTVAPVQQVQASGVPTIDIAAIMNSIKEFFTTNAQWIKENTQWMTQYQLLMRNIVKLGKMITGFNLSPGIKLDTVNLDQGIVAKCGGGFSLDPTQFANMLGVGDENARMRGQKLCGAIIYMKNVRYNYVVDAVNEVLPDITKSLTDLLSTLSSFSFDPGENDGLQTQLSQANNQLNAAAMQMESQLRAYEAVITALEDQQRLNSEVQFRGSGNDGEGGSVLGSVVTNIALSEALDSAAKDD